MAWLGVSRGYFTRFWEVLITKFFAFHVDARDIASAHIEESRNAAAALKCREEVPLCGPSAATGPRFETRIPAIDDAGFPRNSTSASRGGTIDRNETNFNETVITR